MIIIEITFIITVNEEESLCFDFSVYEQFLISEGGGDFNIAAKPNC